MRLEDWQKYLESQYIDSEPAPAEEPQQPEPAQVSVPLVSPQPEAPTVTTVVAAQPVIEVEASITEPEHVTIPEPITPPAPMEAAVEQPQPQTAPATVTDFSSVVEDMEVPSLDRYLPFLRVQNQQMLDLQPEPSTEPEPVAAAPLAVETPSVEIIDTEAPVVEDEVEPEIEQPNAVIEQQEPEPQQALPAQPILAEVEPPAPVAAIVEAPPLPNVSANRIVDEAAISAALPGEPVAVPPAAPAPVAAQEPATEVKPAKSERRLALERRRARQSHNLQPDNIGQELDQAALWKLKPRRVSSLLAYAEVDDEKPYYSREVKETRIELYTRLLDPARQLGETVRNTRAEVSIVKRHAPIGLLTHQRAKNDRRRFRLSDVLAFLEAQSQARPR